MIYGIGIDGVEIARMVQKIQKPHFMLRVFGEAERALLNAAQSPGKKAESAAANFAAKEAFLKAAGRGLGGFPLGCIEALRKESGAPYYRLSGAALRFCEENGLCARLSLCHEGGLALAFAVLEKA